MSTSPRPRRALFIPFALITSAALLLTACGSGTDSGSDTQAAAASRKIPTTDVVSSLKADASAAKLLPAGTDSLTLAVSVGGTPPGTSYLEDGKTLAVQDVDFAAAVAKVLGIKLKREAASFEAILPALDSGKYDVGASNITVTEERKQKYDFATYRKDELAFEAKKGSGWKVTGPKDVAGKKIAVGSGTNQEKILVEWSEEAVKQGLPKVDIKYYQTNQATYLALGSGAIDGYLGPNPTSAYHVATAGQTEIVGTYSGGGSTIQGKIALTTKKGSGLVEAYAAAVNELIKSGDYKKILDRWNLANETVDTSEINPPGLPIEGK